MRLIAIALAVSLSVPALVAKADTTLYNQPFTTTNIDFSSGIYTSYDNFTLGSNGTANAVGWYGGTTGTAPTSFTISFYSDSGGAPGALLGSTVVGDGSPVDTGLTNLGVEWFSYSSAINAISFTGGTPYWMSITGNPSVDYWGWSTGTGGDGASSQNLGAVPTDLAFSLVNTSAVPEPSSLVLLCTGLAGAAGAVRRRIK